MKGIGRGGSVGGTRRGVGEYRFGVSHQDERPAWMRDGMQAVLIEGDEDLEVVGESHYQDNLWELVGGRRSVEVHIRADICAVLVAEDGNPYDANAVSVWVNGLKVGYLSRDDAFRYRPRLLALQHARGQPIALAGVIAGGGVRDDGPGLLGVFLRNDPAEFGFRPAPLLEPPKWKMRAAALSALSEGYWEEDEIAFVAAMNSDLEAEVETLQGLLAAALRRSHLIDFSALKRPAPVLPWEHADLEQAEAAPALEEFMPPPPAGWPKMLGKGKYERAVTDGHARYEQASEAHRSREERRSAALAKARAEWQGAAARRQEEARKQHQEIDAFEAAYRRGERDPVVSYCRMVLEASCYPGGFPQRFKLAYVPDSRQVVVEYELPTVDVVPAVRAYKYVKVSDTISETARPQTQIKALYASAVAQTALRTVHELLSSDTAGRIDTIVFNGVVDTTDPGTGRRVRPCLVTLRTTRDIFSELGLAHVDALACLKHLSAAVSKNPGECVPVRPVLEFSMVDPRFVAESDALSELDQRPNLMELTFLEFEALIQNLFTKMGLEARQTRPSRDGGVDCVAWDPRPIFGGKVVIQAKRYKNTVGVSAVRDLFGTLQNEGASKGILVTTSGYGQASFEFARNKPIGLIDGANLLYLLAEYANINAKIVPPDNWTDPIADMPDATF
jgi:restriction system protein